VIPTNLWASKISLVVWLNHTLDHISKSIRLTDFHSHLFKVNHFIHNLVFVTYERAIDTTARLHLCQSLLSPSSRRCFSINHEHLIPSGTRSILNALKLNSHLLSWFSSHLPYYCALCKSFEAGRSSGGQVSIYIAEGSFYYSNSNEMNFLNFNCC
jgi:hypothetical protein